MCKREKAIGIRVFRLSELRAKLVITKSELSREMGALRTAAERLETAPVPGNVTWPSSRSVRELQLKIKEYRNEADTLIRELASLGVDAGLFKLNGEGQ